MDGWTDGWIHWPAQLEKVHPHSTPCWSVWLWLPNKQPLTVSGFVLSQQPLDAEFLATVKAEKAHGTGRQPKWHKVYPHQASGGRCINKTDAPLPCLKPANMKRVKPSFFGRQWTFKDERNLEGADEGSRPGLETGAIKATHSKIRADSDNSHIFKVTTYR